MLIGFILEDNITDDIVCSSDTNGDGAVNVTDIVAIVNTIVSGGLSLNDDNATEATLIIRGDNLSIEGKNGKIQGVQLTLGHDEDIDILDLVDVDESKLEFAKSNSIDRNTTMIFIIKNDLNYIGTIKGDFKILSKTVVTPIAEEIVSNIVIEPVDFELGTAYPNPFNPTTNLQLVLPETGYVSVKIYNLVGQEVATLAEGIMESNSIGYTLQWNASNMASGVYLVRAEVAGQVSTQKLMLLK